MKTLITISMIMLMPIMMVAQQYQTVYPARETYFKNNEGLVEAIAIDSVTQGTHTTLYPYRINQKKGMDCFSPFVASWAGHSVVINDNGLNYYFNKNNDTIIIDTRARLSDEWDAFYLPDSLLIRATIVDHDLEEFLGLTDSVKTIGFQTFDKEMQPVNTRLNTMQMKISKNHGWVKTLYFYLFPNFNAGWFGGAMQEYELVGLSDPRVGVQNLTWFDVYDYQEGDEIHILTKSGVWEGWVDGYFKMTETRSIYRYIERIDYTDSIQYTFSVEENVIRDWLDSLSYSMDTLVEIIKPNPDFDQMPSQPVIQSFKNSASQISYHYYIMQHDEFTTKTIGNYWFEPYYEDCWYEMHYDGVTYEGSYLKGLGGPYSPYWAMFGYSYGRELTYYQKGSTTWGTPLYISNSVAIVTRTPINVFPNPASESFTVRLGNGFNGIRYKFELYDTSGRMVNYDNLNIGDNTIQISNLRPGIYFYTIRNSNSVLKMDKIVIY